MAVKAQSEMATEAAIAGCLHCAIIAAIASHTAEYGDEVGNERALSVPDIMQAMASVLFTVLDPLPPEVQEAMLSRFWDALSELVECKLAALEDANQSHH